MLDKMEAAKPSMPMVKGDPETSPDSLQLPTAVGSPEITKSPGFTLVQSGPTTNNTKPKVLVTPSLSPVSLGGAPDTSVSTSTSSSAIGATGGFISTPATQIPATQLYPNGMTNELYNKGALPDFKQVAPPIANPNPQYNQGSQVAPNPPASKAPEQFTIPTIDTNAALIMGAIAAGTVTTTNLLNQINQQTKPENQQANAKAAVCNAMQPDQCGGQALKNQVTDPINQKLDAAQIARDANAATQTGMLSSILAKVFSIFDFLQRVWANEAINKAMQYVTMITVIHNAAMLSRSLADTLGSALDAGLQVFGLQIKDKEGNQLGISAALGQTFQNLIKGIIGADNYTALTNTWIQANRIYQTGINLLSNVQSILDSTTAVAELTSNRLGTWMNAARSAGLVRENAYGAQSENVTKFNAFMNKLEALEQGASNAASIAGNVLSVQQSVTELRTNRQEFENALKDKPQGTGLPENDPAKLATAAKKEQSLWTIADFSIVKPPELP